MEIKMKNKSDDNENKRRPGGTNKKFPKNKNKITKLNKQGPK